MFYETANLKMKYKTEDLFKPKKLISMEIFNLKVF